MELPLATRSERFGCRLEARILSPPTRITPSGEVVCHDWSGREHVSPMLQAKYVPLTILVIIYVSLS